MEMMNDEGAARAPALKTRPAASAPAHGCMFGCLGCFGAFAAAVCIAAAAALALPAFISAAAARGVFRSAAHVAPGAGARVLVLDLHGLISLAPEDSLFAPMGGSAQSVLRAVRSAVDDRSVRGILLRVDSGGGEITASDILWRALNDFREADTNRAVAALMGRAAASGAYYVSCAADAIVAHPTTMTGSIGVKIESYNAKALADKIGVKSVTIASGENKDFMNPLKDATPEQEAMLRGMVEALHGRFVSVVAAGRGIGEERVRRLADGRVMLAAEALEAGLIDAIGYEEDAKDFLRRALGDCVFIERTPGFFDFLRDPAFIGGVIRGAVSAGAHSAAPAASAR